MTNIIVRDPETDAKIVRPATAEELAELAAIAPVPQSITKLQLVRHLRSLGLWDDAKALIDADATRAEDWALAVELPIADTTIAAMALALDLDINDTFRAAALL